LTQSKTNVIILIKKKKFDSADYFMEKAAVADEDTSTELEENQDDG